VDPVDPDPQHCFKAMHIIRTSSGTEIIVMQILHLERSDQRYSIICTYHYLLNICEKAKFVNV
jgi:hypothetical protein